MCLLAFDDLETCRFLFKDSSIQSFLNSIVKLLNRFELLGCVTDDVFGPRFRLVCHLSDKIEKIPLIC